MMLPVVKLGSLVLRTICKPIATRLKVAAGRHPRFREYIINIAQVAGAAIIFEVQRSARSEARKEELRKQELEAIKQKEENLERELEFIRKKLAELEQLLSGIFNFKGILMAMKMPTQGKKFIRTLMASQQPMLVQLKIPSPHHLLILLKIPSKVLHLVIEILVPKICQGFSDSLQLLTFNTANR